MRWSLSEHISKVHHVDVDHTYRISSSQLVHSHTIFPNGADSRWHLLNVADKPILRLVSTDRDVGLANPSASRKCTTRTSAVSLRSWLVTTMAPDAPTAPCYHRESTLEAVSSGILPSHNSPQRMKSAYPVMSSESVVTPNRITPSYSLPVARYCGKRFVVRNH